MGDYYIQGADRICTHTKDNGDQMLRCGGREVQTRGVTVEMEVWTCIHDFQYMQIPKNTYTYIHIIYTCIS